MLHLRHIAVWVLLSVFSVGGAVGPVVHQMQHASEQTAATAEAPCHPEAVHTSDVPLWTEGSSAFSGLECDLCARRLLVVPPSLAPTPDPPPTRTTRVDTPSDVVPVQTVTDRFIRGPPSLLGDRPA